MARNGIQLRQARFIAALLTTSDVRAAAASMELPERTAWRWLDSEPFRAELRARQDAAFAQATRAVVSKMTEAADVLATIMHDEAAPTGARVSAARALLECGPRLTETTEILERLGALERNVKNGNS